MKKSPSPPALALFFLAAGAVRLLASGDGPSAFPCQVEEKKPVKSVELLVLDPGASADALDPGNPAGSGAITMGFLVELEPGWHLYWTNPGDAGLAPSVRWTLPPGYEAGPLEHPVPRKSVTEGIVAFEEDGPVLLRCDITPPPSARPSDRWEAAAVLEWMACLESCITGETAVRTVYPPGAAALERGRSLLAQFAPRFPRPLFAAGLSARAPQATLSGGEWRVEIVLSGPRAAEAADFFPYPLEDFVIDHSGITNRAGRIILPLTPSRGPGAPPPPAVRGLVIIEGAGYELDVPVASHHRIMAAGTHSILSGR